VKSFALYLFCGMLAILLRTSVYPLFLSPELCPDLLLVLVIYLGLSENMLRAVLVTILLGGMQDSFAGTSVGLYVFICLVLLLLVRLLSEHLNVESPPLLVLLIVGGTLVQNFLLIFCLTIFADSGPVVPVLFSSLASQMLANLLASVFLLSVILKIQHLFGRRTGLAGLAYQSKRHGT